MDKLIHTSLSPNTQADDVLRSLKVLVSPFAWFEGTYQDKLKNELKKYLGVENVFLLDSGRSSLYAILQSLKLASDAEVLLQSYTCVAVPDPVLWAGLRPVYVDIDPQSLNMDPKDLEKKITKNAQVLIIQHTFGRPADMDALLAIANKHQLFVIEDCAHALGAEYQGQKVGTFGDAAFFSFGRDKVISSVFGGAAVTNNKALAANLTQLYKNLPYPGWYWIKQQLSHPMISALAKTTYLSGIGKAIIAGTLKTGILSRAVYQIEKEGGKPDFILKKLPNALAELAYKQLLKLNKYNQHRIKIAQIYAENLDQKKYRLLSSEKDIHNMYLRFTIFSPKRDEILAVANKAGIVLGDWYNVGIAPKGVNYDKISYDSKTCPNAESAAQQAFNLPTHIGISEKDAHRIVEFLNNYD